MERIVLQIVDEENGGDGVRIRRTRNCKDLRELSNRILSWMPQALRDSGPVAAHGTSLHEIHAPGYNLVTVLRPGSWYNCCMAPKTLFDVNPYLSDPDHYEQFLVINVGSSSAIELGRLPASIVRALNAPPSARAPAKPTGRRTTSERSR